MKHRQSVRAERRRIHARELRPVAAALTTVVVLVSIAAAVLAGSEAPVDRSNGPSNLGILPLDHMLFGLLWAVVLSAGFGLAVAVVAQVLVAEVDGSKSGGPLPSRARQRSNVTPIDPCHG